MKLRNKRTGEIVVFGEGIVDLRRIGCANVAEMIEEGWEDYEEQKEYWYIGADGLIVQNAKPDFINHLLDGLKSVGNYFETKEEAEKAVEKLKAWKRLEDKGFKFDGWEESVESGNNFICFRLPSENWGTDVSKDLDLLFGGEE